MRGGHQRRLHRGPNPALRQAARHSTGLWPLWPGGQGRQGQEVRLRPAVREPRYCH